MSEFVLHHYPQSPVSEKVRVALGIKQMQWRSVHIPRLPPKPEVMILTGGYRRTPIMQVGADIYCDSLCILRALERLRPEPTLFPEGVEQWLVSRWTDGEFFDQAVALVLGSEVDNLPAEFAADRGRLYFGPDFDLHAFVPKLPHLLGQLRAHLYLMQGRLGSGHFMHGECPGLVDALCYYLVWFLRGRYRGGPDMLTEFPTLLAWEERVRGIGHGQWSDLSAEESLDMALESRSAAKPNVDRADPLGLRAGDPVVVTPVGDGGDPPVPGELVILTGDTVAVRRLHERVGEVAVHFPRIGYEVEPV